MTNAPFLAIRSKIAQTEVHTTALKSEIAEYLDQVPVRVVTRLSHDKKFVEYEVIFRTPVPKLFSTRLGDVVHNLRASLDLLAVELVRLNDGNDNGAYFPLQIMQTN